jgi:glycine oxidase
VEAWYGFRPGTPDGLPVIGPDPDLRGLIHATGHFRNGILLTPVTTELIVRCVDGIGDPRLGPFGPDRFSGV